MRQLDRWECIRVAGGDFFDTAGTAIGMFQDAAAVSGNGGLLLVSAAIDVGKVAIVVAGTFLLD